MWSREYETQTIQHISGPTSVPVQVPVPASAAVSEEMIESEGEGDTNKKPINEDDDYEGESSGDEMSAYVVRRSARGAARGTGTGLREFTVEDADFEDADDNAAAAADPQVERLLRLWTTLYEE